MKYIFSAFFIIFFMYSYLYGDNIFTLSDIYIKGSRIDKITEKSPYTKSVISVDKLKSEEKTIGEILENIPGVHITSLAGRGSYTVTSIRGSTSSQVLVYIDGILLNSGGNSSVDLSNIPLEEVKSIEIYRGNVPAQFGRGGIGGVINIITKKNLKKKVNISTSYGSWKFYKFDTNVKYKSFFMNSGAEGRTGDYPYLNDANTPFNKNDDYHARRLQNYYNQKNLLINYKRNISDKVLSLTYRHFYKHNELPGAAPGRDTDISKTDATLKNKDNHIEANFAFNLFSGVAGIKSYFSNNKKFFYNPKKKIGAYGLLKSKYNTDKFGINFSYELEKNNFINLKIYNQNSYEILTNNFTPDTSFTHDGKYRRFEYNFTMENDLYLFKKSFIIAPVIRKNILDDENKKTGVKNYCNKDTYSIGVKYIPPFFQNIYLKLNYGKFVRYPNFYEKFGNGATILPGNNLTYEKSKNLDYGIGFKYKFLFAEITYFRNIVKNLIEFIMVNERYSIYKNIENADIKGLEFSFNINLENVILFNVNYTTLETKSQQTGYKKNQPLPNRPGHTFYARFQFNIKNCSYWTEFNETGKNYFDDGGNYYYNTYHIVNTGLKYNFSEKLKINFTIKNLLNNQDMYAYVQGYNIPKTPYYPLEGRSFYINLNYYF